MGVEGVGYERVCVFFSICIYFYIVIILKLIFRWYPRYPKRGLFIFACDFEPHPANPPARYPPPGERMHRPPRNDRRNPPAAEPTNHQHQAHAQKEPRQRCDPLTIGHTNRGPHGRPLSPYKIKSKNCWINRPRKKIDKKLKIFSETPWQLKIFSV